MDNKIRILAVIPYEEMIPLIHEISADFDNVYTEPVLEGNSLLSMIGPDDYDKYDAVIKTDSSVIPQTDIPVVELEHTMTDLMMTFNYAAANTSDISIIGSSGTQMVYRSLISQFPMESRFYVTNDTDLDTVFSDISKRGMNTVVCDSSAYNKAKSKGLNAIRLFYGSESIKSAFSKAVSISKTTRQLRKENHIMRKIISEDPGSHTIVFTSSGAVIEKISYTEYSQLYPFLSEQIDNFADRNSVQAVHRHGGFAYHIQGNRIHFGDDTYYVFYITRSSTQTKERRGITYYSPEEIQEDLETSVFGIAGVESYYTTEINQASARKDPILISGEIGIGKDHMAKTIYMRSSYNQRPFVIINCAQIIERTWNYLLRKELSPLYDKGNFIFIQNIDALTYDQNMQLISVIADSNAASSNRIAFSCSEQRAMSAIKHQQMLKTINMLHCQVIFMKPLRGQDDVIRNSVNFLLANLSKEYSFSPSGIHPLAMNELIRFSWPQNFEQLKRVIEKLAIRAGNDRITADHTAEVFRSEMNLAQGETGQTSNTIIDLTQSLSDINRDIVRIVLEQTDGNQTEAAARLGIGRSTLWRMMNPNRKNNS